MEKTALDTLMSGNVAKAARKKYPMSERAHQNKLAYTEDYQRANIKRVTVKLNRKVPRQLAILEYLESLDNVQGLIIGLLEEHMNRSK